MGVLFGGTKGSVKVSWEILKTDPIHLGRQTIKPDQVQLHRSPDDNHPSDLLRSARACGRNASDADITYRSITVCHLGNIAMDLGRPLRWDPFRECFQDDFQANRLLNRAARNPYFT